MKINGNGWACNQGYKEVGDGCMYDRVTRSPDPAEDGRPGRRLRQLVRENAKLKREIDRVSLQNAVLTAEQSDEP